VTLKVAHCSIVSAFDGVGGPVLLVAVRTNSPCVLHRGNCLGYRWRHFNEPDHE